MTMDPLDEEQLLRFVVDGRSFSVTKVLTHPEEPQLRIWDLSLPAQPVCLFMVTLDSLMRGGTVTSMASDDVPIEVFRQLLAVVDSLPRA